VETLSTVESPGYRLRVRQSRGLPRFFDALIGFFGLLIGSPLLVIAAAAVKLSSRGPLFVHEPRVGSRGEIFHLLRFRTTLSSRSEVFGGPPGQKAVLSPLGGLLRRSRLYRLPELWNLALGDVALVGLHPEVPRMVDFGNPLWREALAVRPGVVDPVSQKVGSEESILDSVIGNREAFCREVLQPYKLRAYSNYLRSRSPWTDLRVLGHALLSFFEPPAPPMSIAELSNPQERADVPEPDTQRTREVASGFSLRHVQYLLDLLVLAAAFWISYLLRFDFRLTAENRSTLFVQLPWVLFLQSGALLLAGVHRFIWRYVAIREARRFLEAALWSGVALVLARLLAPFDLPALRVPLSVIIMDTVFAFCGVLALRVGRRIAYERERREDVAETVTTARRRVLLLGAGQAGVLAAREIQGRGDLDIEIHGFVDDDVRKQGALIHGVPVLGTTRDLASLVAEHRIQDIVITIAQISRREILRMMEICRKIGVNVRIIPGLYEILQGNVRVTRIRDVEIEDLLGRERVYLDEDEIGGFVAGKRVMVTGAGGSIGSELARQVARFGPSVLILLERAEFVLFDIDKELRRLYPDLRIVPVVADVGDATWIRNVFKTHTPHVVFHAAAHKHVPMMEANPCEAIKNNIFGTRVIAEISADSGVEAFVMISTDKAVRPTSVMGASKRVAELVVQDLARRSSTRFVAVRFGNVMGSAGSVIPIFREQIQRGGPVTVTDPEMKRYFMTIPEAAQLVMQAGAMGRGGEIFILDMGHPVRILDLAVAMINLSGLRPFEDIEIVFTGLRPGEKLFEELELDGEDISKTRHPKIFIGSIAPYPPGIVERALQDLEQLARTADSIAIREYLAELLPEATLARPRRQESAPGVEPVRAAPQPGQPVPGPRKTNPPESSEIALFPVR